MKYTHVAVFIHWVTALLIIGLLAIGHFMTGLDETDTLRFTLTQSHKTFGILVLLLSGIRILWRLTHRAPPHPQDAPTWEKFAASLSHLAFYGLIFVLPLSGWAMVSVSSLNIDTLLFNTIEWPHLPISAWLNLNDTTAQDQWASRFHHTHELAGKILIALLLVHVGAALKHHFIDKDDVLYRMKPRISEPGFLGLLAFAAILVGSTAFALTQMGQTSSSADWVVGNSSVTLVADVTAEETLFEFSNTSVTANIDINAPEQSTLVVSVLTAEVRSDNLQAVGSLPDADWFDVANFPEATFQSSSFEAGQEPNTLLVTGDLTIKDITLPVAFPLSITSSENTEESTAAVDLAINRFDYSIGLSSQPDEDYVGAIVTIQLRFQLGAKN